MGPKMATTKNKISTMAPSTEIFRRWNRLKIVPFMHSALPYSYLIRGSTAA